MNELLNYPFDSKIIRRKRVSLKKDLLKRNDLIKKKVAILGGSTTHDIMEMLELFLLNYGICPEFYESEYGQYWQDAMFENGKLDSFNPDVIFIHTSNRNISCFPDILNTAEEVDTILMSEYSRFQLAWEKLKERFSCPIIQNNFEYPFYRLQGNRDASDYHGKVNFITRLNLLFYEYSQKNKSFFINDINYQAADYGLEKWSDPFYWYMYKYALNIDAIPILAFNVANIIKSFLGKNKKALALDLDNTLWGGVVGDDGVENLRLGVETAEGEAYTEFQAYLKELGHYGVLLNIISKNEYENAISGMNHPKMLLKKEDFISIKANWENKSKNLIDMADELSLLPESFVFVDDNPAEREIIRRENLNVGIVKLDNIEHYIKALDKTGYFEMTSLSQDDLKRKDMYKENMVRKQKQNEFSDYNEYLLSLEMKAEIKPFEALYMQRIAQLTNKSNQFNLTTRRFIQEEIENISNDKDYITMYGTLSDCFGDNGIVSVVIGKKCEVDGKKELDIILWLMSCRVLKRNMEYAMMDELVRLVDDSNLERIRGHYYPSGKNNMVRDFYGQHGFNKIGEDDNGNTTWILEVQDYCPGNHVIEVNGK